MKSPIPALEALVESRSLGYHEKNVARGLLGVQQAYQVSNDPVLVALQNLEPDRGTIRSQDREVWLTWAADSVVLLPPD